MRRVIVIVVLIAVFFVAAIPILGSAQSSATGSASTQTTTSRATVDRGEVKLTVSATGKIVVGQQSNLSFDQSAQVKEVLVAEGQQVLAGQVLSRQDDSTQQASLAQANDAVNAADAALQKLLRPVDAGDIAKAEANVKAAQASYSSKANAVSLDTIKGYDLQVQKAQAAADAAEQNRIHTGGQYKTDDPNYQKALAQVGQAQINVQVAQLQLQQASQGSSLLSATAQITYQQALLAQLKVGPTQGQIEAAQASLMTAKLQRDQAQHNLDKTHLVAPFAGVIASVSAKAGEISSGTAMVIADTSELDADINVDEADIGKIQVGQPVQITLDALSGVTLNGKVQRIAETADTTTSVITYVVHVVLDPAKAALRPGMTTNATFLAQDLKNALRVPNNYLKVDRTTNQTTVNVVSRNGAVAVVPVKLGVQGTDYSEVIEGLREGDTITLITSSSAASAGSNG
jgi:HlyD family secretion protein